MCSRRTRRPCVVSREFAMRSHGVRPPPPMPSPPPLAPQIPPVSLALGIAIIITGCASSSIGLALMKQSSEVERDLPCHSRWRWMLGFIFLVVNATVLVLIEYGLIPLAIIAPFAGLTMVFSLILAVSGLLHERESLSITQGFAALLVIIGVVVASHFGPHSSANVDSMDEILRDFHDGHFLAFAAVTLGQVALYLAVLHVPALSWMRPPETSPLTTAFSAYTASVCGALSQLFMKVVSLALQTLGTKGPVVLQQPTVYIATTHRARRCSCICSTRPSRPHPFRSRCRSTCHC